MTDEEKAARQYYPDMPLSLAVARLRASEAFATKVHEEIMASPQIGPPLAALTPSHQVLFNILCDAFRQTLIHIQHYCNDHGVPSEEAQKVLLLVLEYYRQKVLAEPRLDQHLDKLEKEGAFNIQ